MAWNLARIGRYDLITALATGGMGRIYLGKSTGLGGFERKVVIKALEVPVDVESDPAIAMFLDEARLLGLLHHQHIASVFEVGRDDDGRHYIVLDYVEGYSAHDVWERAYEFGAALPLDFSLTVVSAAANALHYTHTCKDADGMPLGIVHRDVTPSNVMIGYDGAVKLIDFGIAMAASRTTKTQTGYVKGKVSYLSPEQVAGHDVDARTDVFALGILLYELSTLHRTFRESSDLATMQRIKFGDVVRPSLVVSGYPLELEAIVMKALQVDPRDRFADADAMRRAIEALGHRLHFVLGDAAVIEVMAQLYEPQAPGASPHPPSQAADPSLGWSEFEHELTVRRDPQELLEAMRAANASLETGEVTTRRPATPVQAAARPRRLRAATEAADALIFQSSDAPAVLLTPTTPFSVVKPETGKPETGNSEAGNSEAGNSEAGNSEAGNSEAGNSEAGNSEAGNSEAGNSDAGNSEAGNPDAAKPGPGKPVTAKPAQTAPANPKIGASLVLGQTKRSSRLRWIGASALLGALGVVGYIVMQGSWNAVARSSSRPAPPSIAAPGPEVRSPAAPAAPPTAPPTPPPAPAKVHVRIVTHPADATVLLDGKKLGHTPLDETIAAEPGKHVVKLRHRGYTTQMLDIELDTDILQDVTLAPQK